MRAHQPGSTPIDIPETVPNPAYTPAPAPAPERAPTKVPEKVPEKVISGIAEVTATSNGGLNPKLLIWLARLQQFPAAYWHWPSGAVRSNFALDHGRRERNF
jgi:hypothetical protein